MTQPVLLHQWKIGKNKETIKKKLSSKIIIIVFKYFKYLAFSHSAKSVLKYIIEKALVNVQKM